MDAITKIGVRRRYGSLSNYFGQMLSNQKYFSANGKGPAIVTRLVLAPEWSGGHDRRHRVQGFASDGRTTMAKHGEMAVCQRHTDYGPVTVTSRRAVSQI